MMNKETVHLGRSKLDYYKLIDETFTATWSKKDGEMIKRIYKAAREGMMDDQSAASHLSTIEFAIRRKWNDHHTNNIQLPYEPLEVSYKYDGVTDYGLSLFCGLIIGKSLPHISHMAAGDGVGDTVDYQDTLISERARYAFNENGYMGSINKDMRFAMTFDILLPTFTVREIGLFNVETDNTGPLIARTNFDPGVVHTQGSNYVTVNYLLSLLSS